MLSSDLQKIFAKSLTLVTVNILQPVEKSSLVDRLQSTIDADQIDYILDELTQAKKVVNEQGKYRLTHRGMQSIPPARGRVLRDIQRMKYLTHSAKQRGGD